MSAIIFILSFITGCLCGFTLLGWMDSYEDVDFDRVVFIGVYGATFSIIPFLSIPCTLFFLFDLTRARYGQPDLSLGYTPNHRVWPVSWTYVAAWARGDHADCCTDCALDFYAEGGCGYCRNEGWCKCEHHDAHVQAHNSLPKCPFCGRRDGMCRHTFEDGWLGFWCSEDDHPVYYEIGDLPFDAHVHAWIETICPDCGLNCVCDLQCIDCGENLIICRCHPEHPDRHELDNTSISNFAPEGLGDELTCCGDDEGCWQCHFEQQTYLLDNDDEVWALPKHVGSRRHVLETTDWSLIRSLYS